MKTKNPKIIVILGPTASGKTAVAVKLARKFNGEVVSADSRQVYIGMDIGSGKDLKEYEEVPYHMIDVADPKHEFDLAQYKEKAEKAIDDIAARGKLPFLVGGSGMYLQAVVDNYELSKTKADPKLREELEKLDENELYEKLKTLNKGFAEKLQISDQKNKRRLIRYIEIQTSGTESLKKGNEKYETLIIGLYKDKKIIEEKIYKRLIDRLEKESMVDEVAGLQAHGVDWKRLDDFGLEYRYIGRYLQEKMGYEEMVEKLFIAIRQFAKRQMTWFRRWERQGKKINWFSGADEMEKIEKLIEQFNKKEAA